MKSALADLLSKQCKHGETEVLWRQLLEVQERVQGPEHLDTLVSKSNLASTLQSRWRGSMGGVPTT